MALLELRRPVSIIPLPGSPSQESTRAAGSRRKTRMKTKTAAPPPIPPRRPFFKIALADADDWRARHELPYVLGAAEQREVRLLWIYVSPALVEEAPGLLDLQCAHSYDRPLDSLAPHELTRCLVEIAREIRAAYDAR